ncbi:RNA polymerase sigma-70 factor (ECF subfamily) [Roseimicrobium gellanilyticum]|uniref:RNA polymerase sigma-70 factor (ECF subfamily) n=1 Tax=Roseimicrobium gellanilyticum TaxID=748857 RepID=A0A366HVF4_9BACT|nr:sigma-70 family RNA polymerase sigma factor [Roseimicrobium gellanilyticum]RBP47850.1 RNA polymerase sigma-70 factor (ECF subfamily) [Roseimicrobium gellanilyticum]
MTTDSPGIQSGAVFHTTRWTRVCLAKVDSEDGRRALAELCDAYYEPVVAFFRCELRNADAAREMSHAFFAQMLGGGAIRTAERERGRFRSYLLGAARHFLFNQHAAGSRQKRGGGAAILAIDDEEAREVADARQVSPDAEFDRQWALTVLARALDALKAECTSEGRTMVFERVKPWLMGDADHGDQAGLAAELGLSPSALRMSVHRLKQRFRHLVKGEIAGTLDDPAMVDEEMRSLFAALGG